MAVTYGFYDSVSGDRVYNALQFGSIFDGIVADGVFQSQGGMFAVSPGTGMAVNVAAGRAWFDHTWTYNDGVLSVSIDTSEPVLDRIDTVVIETDSNPANRVNSIKVIKGTPGASPVPPTLTHTSTVNQYPIADVYVAATVTSFIAANITNRVGTADCPFVTGILETLNVAWMFAQWESEFDTWFNNLVDQLTGVQVTNLQNQIDYIMRYDDWRHFRNILINGDMSVSQRGISKAGITTSMYAPAPDRWYLDTNLGSLTAEQRSDVAITDEGFQFSYKLTSTTADSLSASSKISLGQKIEGLMLQDIKKGISAAEDLTLTFWVKSNVVQTFIVELFDTENDRTISRSYTISASATWEQVSLTFPGDTSGPLSADNLGRLEVIFWLAAGSDYTSGTLQTSWGSRVNANRAVGCYNFGAGATNYIEFTGIQLEIAGSGLETNFEWVPYDINLDRCKRYYQFVCAGDNHPNGNTGMILGLLNYTHSAQAWVIFELEKEMRDVPNEDIISGTSYWTTFSASPDVHNGFTVMNGVTYWSTPKRVILQGSGVSGTAGTCYWSYVNNDAAYLGLSAEL